MCAPSGVERSHGFITRRKLAAGLARHEIGTVMLEGAYYGERRPGAGQPVRTVADCSRLTRSVIEEGRGLLSGLLEAGLSAGVSGFSMGGSLAAVVGASLDGDSAIAPPAAGFSPAPSFVDGAIRHAVDWEALGGRDAVARLEAVLLRADTRLIEPLSATRTAVLVAALSDGYIPAYATAGIHDHWPGSELRHIRAGHATLIVRKHAVLAGAIADSFVRAGLLEARTGRGGRGLPSASRGNSGHRRPPQRRKDNPLQRPHGS